MSLTIDLAPEVFDAGMSEEYEGVGLRWAAVDAGSGLIVEWLHSTGPAAAAGVQLGDELLAVDGRQTRQAATLDIVSWVRGPAGTWVKLSLRRAGYVFDLNVQRGRLAY
ncbi:MAG: PDZ domain-containing protein [Myxococcales bacterium]|nr:PDZ domain-containing protein [Myxococcales bacterium]